MNNTQIIQKAIELCQGKVLPLGALVGHPSDEIAQELIAYEDGGKTAVLEWDGAVKRFPANEIVDVNEVKRVALALKAKQLNNAALHEN